MAREPRDADTDEAQGARAVGKRTVEQTAREVADLLGVVDADAQ